MLGKRGVVDNKRKAEEINLVLNEKDVDLWRLRELALSDGGLVNDDLRKAAWPKLVGLHDRYFHETPRASVAAASPNSNDSANITARGPLPPKPKPVESSLARQISLERQLSLDTHANDNASVHSSGSQGGAPALQCQDFLQIERDVARCTWHLLTGNQRAVGMQMEHKRHKKVARLIRRKQRRLANLVNGTLQQESRLRYYQGYHDVACIFLSTLGGQNAPSVKSPTLALEHFGLDLAGSVLLQVSETHLGDFLKTNFAQLQNALRLTLFPMLALFDRPVHDHLKAAELEPFFCLSWVLTWFSHEIRDTALVKRLFDAFLVSHPLMPIYLSVAMILHPMNREEVLSTECDFATLHQTLQGLPRNSSMVGWKYRPGDGYVSDDEAPDDESTLEGGNEGDLLLETQVADLSFLQRNNKTAHEAGTVTTIPDGVSIESSHLSSLFGSVRVPFQELIDLALRYMNRMPPHKLVSLATRYHAGTPPPSDEVQLLRPAPAWAFERSSEADWVLQQRAQSRLGRRGRRNIQKRSRSRSSSRSRLRSATVDNSNQQLGERDDEELTKEDWTSHYLKENLKSRPVIALGCGKWANMRAKRRRRRLIAGAVAIVVIAIGTQFILKSHRVSSSEPVYSVPDVSQVDSNDRVNGEATKPERSCSRAVVDVADSFAEKARAARKSRGSKEIESVRTVTVVEEVPKQPQIVKITRQSEMEDDGEAEMERGAVNLWGLTAMKSKPASTTKKEELPSTPLNIIQPPADEWKKHGANIRESMPLPELSGVFLKAATNFVRHRDKVLQISHKQWSVLRNLFDDFRNRVLSFRLDSLPIASIRMVRKVCKKDGEYSKLEKVPIFC